MNENAGPACALSVLIVGIFAVLLHDKHPPSTALASSPPTAPSLAEAGPARIQPEIDPRVREAADEASFPASAPRKPTPPTPTPTAEIKADEATQAALAARIEPKSRPVARRDDRRSPPDRRGSATVVEGGETLADVAARVYGSPEAAEVIWKANRDQLVDVDAPLTRGMLLRTP